MKSLYTNIPNNEGIKPVTEAYDNHPTKTVVTKVILILNNFVLKNKLCFVKQVLKTTFWTHWYIKTRTTLQATFYWKPTDQQSYLHVHSDHPKSLKNAYRIVKRCIAKRWKSKTTCSTLTEYKKHCAILKQKFIERGYKENVLKDQIDKVDNTDRKDL